MVHCCQRSTQTHINAIIFCNILEMCCSAPFQDCRSKLGPKCQYFVCPPLFSSTALILLGMEFTRASQVATGVLFHSSMTTSQSWWMLETLRSSTFHLRMPYRCSIGFRSGYMLGQYMLFLARQWSLSCWNTALWPSLRREGIMLCFSISQYMLAFMVPSMNCISTVPTALTQPQNITLPPPCLNVGKTHSSLYSSPGCRHTRLAPSEPNKFILVSSDDRTWFQ